MKNVFIILFIVLAIGLVAYGVNKSKNSQEAGDAYMMDENKATDDNQAMEDDKMMNDNQAMEDDKMMGEPGQYLPYDASLLARAETGKVVLFFHAAWCPTCKGLEKNINMNLNDIPTDLTILKVDYDTASDLKDKYGIVIQHTLVQVDSKGNEITKWTGGYDIASIVKHLK